MKVTSKHYVTRFGIVATGCKCATCSDTRRRGERSGYPMGSSVKDSPLVN